MRSESELALQGMINKKYISNKTNFLKNNNCNRESCEEKADNMKVAREHFKLDEPVNLMFAVIHFLCHLLDIKMLHRVRSRGLLNLFFPTLAYKRVLIPYLLSYTERERTGPLW